MAKRLALVLLANLMRFGFQSLYFLFSLIPAPRRVVFLSRQSNSISRDQSAVLDELSKRNVPVVVLNRKLGTFYALHMVRQTWHLAHARSVLLDSYSILTSNLSLRSSVPVVQMWHALGTFKRYGWADLGEANSFKRFVAKTMRMHAGNTVVLASSALVAPNVASAFNVDLSLVSVCPVPRVDRFLSKEFVAETRSRIYSAHPEFEGKKVLVFAPTLSKGQLLVSDLSPLTVFCEKNGYRLLNSTHPVEAKDGSRFLTEDLLTIADVFVTDQSSMIYEAGLMGIPGFLITDSSLKKSLIEKSFLSEAELSPIMFETASELETLVKKNSKVASELANRHITITRESAASKIAALL